MQSLKIKLNSDIKICFKPLVCNLNDVVLYSHFSLLVLVVKKNKNLVTSFHNFLFL